MSEEQNHVSSKQFYSLHNKSHCMDQKVLIHLFKLRAISICGVETWFIKLHTKDLNNISIPYHKAIKACATKDRMIAIMKA